MFKRVEIVVRSGILTSKPFLSCGRVKMKRSRKKNPDWNHYKVVTPERATCNYCSAPISTQNSNTTNITSHLRTHHTPIYLKMTQGEPGGSGSSQSQSVSEGHRLDDLEDERVQDEHLGDGDRVGPSPSPSPSPTPSTSSGLRRDTRSPAPFSPPASPAPSSSR